MILNNQWVRVKRTEKLSKSIQKIYNLRLNSITVPLICFWSNRLRLLNGVLKFQNNLLSAVTFGSYTSKTREAEIFDMIVLKV